MDGGGDTTITVNQKFYALWQFSHFIRPGFQIIGAGDANSLAAYNPTNQTLVIVTVNDTTNALKVNYDLSAFSAVGGQANGYRTSASERAAALGGISLTNQEFATTLASESVTTFVVPSAVATNHAPSISPVAGCTLLAGRILTITNLATDLDLPTQTLSWSLVSPPVGMTINPSNGLITWRPAIAQSPATNTVSVVVADNGVPRLSATQHFDVAVSRPSSPLISAPAWDGDSISFLVNGDAGPDYVIEVATNLGPTSVWIPLTTNLSATPPFQPKDKTGTNSWQRFYRVRLRP